VLVVPGCRTNALLDAALAGSLGYLDEVISVLGLYRPDDASRLPFKDRSIDLILHLTGAEVTEVTAVPGCRALRVFLCHLGEVCTGIELRQQLFAGF
jgi:hypothetical protein